MTSNSQLAQLSIENNNKEEIPFIAHDIDSHSRRNCCKEYKKSIIIALILLIGVLLTFAVIYFVVNIEKNAKKSCPKYKHDLIVVGLDGFRWDYLTKEYQSRWNINLTNFNKLKSAGAHIEKLQPVFPTVTSPNFYTLSTGLYPGDHGIPWNEFYDPHLNASKRYDPISDEDLTGVWWLANPIWTTVQKNDLKSAVLYWEGSRSNNNFNGNNGGFADWYLKDYDYHLDFYDRTDILLNELNNPYYNLAMIYYSEPDETAHQYGPDSNETAQILEYDDKVLGYLLNGLDEIYGDTKYNLIIVSDHGFTECIVPSPLILDMNVSGVYLDAFFRNRSLFFDVTAPQLPIKIDYDMFDMESEDEVNDFVIDLLRNSILNVSLYENKVFWMYKKGELPYSGVNSGRFDYRLSDIVIDVKLGYEWNIINSWKYNRIVDCGGGHSWNNSQPDMQTTLIGYGPDFKKNYVKKEAQNIHFYELMCKLMCDTKPDENDGSFDQIKDILVGY